MTNIFHVTFGQKYSYEPHPRFPGAHPEALLEVHADDEMTARELVIETIGTQWAFIYPASAGMDTKISPFTNNGLMFSRGVTHSLTKDGLRRADARSV